MKRLEIEATDWITKPSTLWNKDTQPTAAQSLIKLNHRHQGILPGLDLAVLGGQQAGHSRQYAFCLNTE
jgi:hypothetical protein